jgi:hypothetical protein
MIDKVNTNDVFLNNDGKLYSVQRKDNGTYYDYQLFELSNDNGIWMKTFWKAIKGWSGYQTFIENSILIGKIDEAGII